MSGRGQFITFEGGEGSGKSTQIARLAEALRGRGLDVVVTREPGGSPAAEILRSILLGGHAKMDGPLAEAALFAAARADHLASVIRPALEAGSIVLCDRFADSTRVYQGVAGGIDTATLEQIEAAAIGPTWPDLTLVLDINEKTRTERRSARTGESASDRFEDEDGAFHAAIAQGFRDLAQREPQRIRLIDAGGSMEVVSERIEAEILALIEPAA